MTDQTDNQDAPPEDGDQGGKRLLKVKPGRLDLKRTVDAGQVRQNFSHGRSKSVNVEVRRSRTFTPPVGGFEAKTVTAAPAAPAKPEPAEEQARKAAADSPARRPAVLRTLTEEEAEVRARALQGARESGSASAQLIDQVSKETEARRNASLLDEESREQEDSQRREEEDRRRSEEEERKRSEEEAARKALEQSERLEARAATEDPTRPPRRPAVAEIAEDEDKRPRRPGKGDTRRPGPRRTAEPRRRAGRLTVAQALNDEERVRSLASVRRARERERRAQSQPLEAVKVVREVVIPEEITVQELSNRMAERGVDVIKALMKLGVMATMPQSIDPDTAELVVSEFGHKSKRVSEADVEIGLKGPDDDEKTLKPRPPVVTVMGHVDHGKTSLLDALRETDVVSGEAGGITQHIGAYQVTLAAGGKITFIDTPGHAAFTAMRARGANVTDIVVLVVAADDGVMPQTVEAIAHAKAAEVPIIVAINKVDKTDADPNRVRNDLLQHELVDESVGGDILSVEVSATAKTNLDKLEEAILLQAEVLELQANPDRAAEGIVIEANLDRGRGAVATVLVQRGTLRIGDIVVAGGEWGRVRALLHDTGINLEEAGPSMPVSVLGLAAPPMAGDEFAVVPNEARAREITEYRQRRERALRGAITRPTDPEDIFAQLVTEDMTELAIVIKADTHGSAEAIQSSLKDFESDNVKVDVLHAGVGGINESDISLALASKALVIGFNVRANSQARVLATRDGVEIRYHSIIYNLIDDIKQLLTGMLKPFARETFLGNAEILEVFVIGKQGKVAGCNVTEGMVRRGSAVRLVRDSVVIHEGKLATLQRFKDEVREVRDGTECGMSFENYQDIKVGDVIECFDVQMVARTL
jgi:translation initiation factor IF-2